MRFQTLGNKPTFVSDFAKNGEASASITFGQPVVLKFNATDDGLAVVLPSSSSAAKANAFFYGVAMETLTPGQIGNAVRSGYCRYAILLRQSRTSASTDWVSEVSQDIGVHLTLDTVNNCFVTTVSSGTTATNAIVSQSNNLVRVMLANTLASYASSGSATTDTRVLNTVAVAVYIRDM